MMKITKVLQKIRGLQAVDILWHRWLCYKRSGWKQETIGSETLYAALRRKKNPADDLIERILHRRQSDVHAT